jgi:hypothetical protein
MDIIDCEKSSYIDIFEKIINFLWFILPMIERLNCEIDSISNFIRI